MRVKRKKHLKERLDAVSDYIIVCEREIVNVLEAIKDKRIIDFQNVFLNDNPVCLEVGCGKGGFIARMATNHPEKNFLAAELLDSIIVAAAELVQKKDLENVRFMNTGAEYLPRYIKDGSISEIYLNFSPPYPAKSYENRRLTNSRYLQVFYSMLTPSGVIYQKTDDRDFFDYSVKKYIENGFKVQTLSDGDDLDFIRIKTEYEEKFLQMGLNIFRLKATKI